LADPSAYVPEERTGKKRLKYDRKLGRSWKNKRRESPATQEKKMHGPSARQLVGRSSGVVGGQTINTIRV